MMTVNYSWQYNDISGYLDIPNDGWLVAEKDVDELIGHYDSTVTNPLGLSCDLPRTTLERKQVLQLLDTYGTFTLFNNNRLFQAAIELNQLGHVYIPQMTDEGTITVSLSI